MPMLEHAAGDEPEIKLVVRGLGGRFIGRGDKVGLLVGIAIKLEPAALLDIGIVALTIAPERLLSVHHGPPLPPALVIGVERRQIVPMTAAEARVFLE